MSVKERIRRYRSAGGAADLVRVEVLVPASARAEVLAHAAAIRKDYRETRDQLQQRIDQAIQTYGARVLDNVDLSRLPNAADRARVVGKALIERGDARAFIIGRRLLEAAARWH